MVNQALRGLPFMFVLAVLGGADVRAEDANPCTWNNYSGVGRHSKDSQDSIKRFWVKDNTSLALTYESGGGSLTYEAAKKDPKTKTETKTKGTWSLAQDDKKVGFLNLVGASKERGGNGRSLMLRIKTAAMPKASEFEYCKPTELKVECASDGGCEGLEGDYKVSDTGEIPNSTGQNAKGAPLRMKKEK